MSCEQCNKQEDEWFAYVPILQPDGKLNIKLCASCAVQSSAYCIIHKIPHSPFTGNTSICHTCVDVLFASVYTPLLEESLHQRSKELQENEQFEELVEIVQACADLRNTIFTHALIYMACRYSLSRHIPIEETLSRILDDKDITESFLLLEE